MSDTMILHHYEASPYAEKIRLMFGLTNTPWKSLLSPAKPPRPNLDPLTGGYRRIPVLQMGADIICDTSLIAEEIANLTHSPQLNPANIEGEAASLMHRAEQEAFFAAVAAVPPLRLLTTMWLKLGPMEIIPFIKDRTGMLKGGTQKRTHPEKAKQILANLIEDLETRLSEIDWIAGDKPSVADFAIYHVLWLHVNFNRKPLEAGPQVLNWYQAVSNVGHGPREDVAQAYGFQMAKASSPRPLPDSIADSPVAPGTEVKVAPSDYGLTPVVGKVAAITDDKIILARETEQFGLLHVHFPGNGYSISEC